MLNILDIIEQEIINKWGPYKGSRKIVDGDPMITPCCDGEVEPDYVIYVSRPVMEGLYGASLSRGFMMKTCLCEDQHSFIRDWWQQKDYSVKYQFPKIGVIQVVHRLEQGYLIQKENESEYKMELSEKIKRSFI